MKSCSKVRLLLSENSSLGKAGMRTKCMPFMIRVCYYLESQKLISIQHNINSIPCDNIILNTKEVKLYNLLSFNSINDSLQLAAKTNRRRVLLWLAILRAFLIQQCGRNLKLEFDPPFLLLKIGEK
jgi:hypothetical protein